MASSALGQPADRSVGARWEAGVLAGWYSGATPYVVSGPVSGDVRLEESATLGVRLGVDPSPRWGMELDWTRAEPELALAASGEKIRRLRLDFFELNANLYFGSGALRGFVLGGVGAANSGSSFGGANLNVDAGLGLSVLLARHLDLRLDARFRDTYGNLGPKDRFAFCDSTGCYAYRHKWYGSYGFSGGVSYVF